MFKKFNLNIFYSCNPTFKDGFTKYHGYQNLDVTISRTLNNNFSLFLFASDLFRSKVAHETTTVPYYYYGFKRYNDNQAFGISIRYNLKGNTFKKFKYELKTDESLERMK